MRVLVLAEWGETEVSSRIDSEYGREIPRLYRAIQRIDELGGHANMNPAANYAEHLPRGGCDLPEMLIREAGSLGDFQLSLRDLGEALGKAGEEVGAAIARDAYATRGAFVDWVSETMERAPDWERRLAPPLSGDRAGWQGLLAVYGYLGPAIEETVVHMLLLHRAGETEAASASWRDSWAYMLYAAEAVRLMADRNWSFDFDAISPPQWNSAAVGTSAKGAVASNERRHLLLAESIPKLGEALQGSGDVEVQQLCRSAADYLAARARREPGTPPRKAPEFAEMLSRQQF